MKYHAYFWREKRNLEVPVPVLEFSALDISEKRDLCLWALLHGISGWIFINVQKICCRQVLTNLAIQVLPNISLKSEFRLTFPLLFIVSDCKIRIKVTYCDEGAQLWLSLCILWNSYCSFPCLTNVFSQYREYLDEASSIYKRLQAYTFWKVSAPLSNPVLELSALYICKGNFDL